MLRFKTFLFEQNENKPPFQPLKGDNSSLHRAFNLITLADDLYDRSETSPESGNNHHTELLHSALGHLHGAIVDHLEHHHALYQHPKLPSFYHTETMRDHQSMLRQLIELHFSVKEQLKSPLMPPLSSSIVPSRSSSDNPENSHEIAGFNVSSKKERANLMGYLWRQHNEFITPKSKEEITKRDTDFRTRFLEDKPEFRDSDQILDHNERIRDITHEQVYNLGRFFHGQNENGDDHGDNYGQNPQLA